MYYYLFVFSSRNESMAFNEYLKVRGINSTLISTPKECMTGCGLSVKVASHYLAYAQNYLMTFQYKYTYRGLYKCVRDGIRNIISKVR